MDYRRMYDDKEHIYAFDLEGKDRTLEIAGVSRGELTGQQNRKTKKPIVSFVGETKKLALNKTNGKTIAALYGTDGDDWVGELITIYPTTTTFGGETVDCIRVRPKKPERSAGKSPAMDERKSSGSRQTKAERDAAEVSTVTGRHLVGEYEKCENEEKLAELKIARGRAWPTLFEADRIAVGAAALAAKDRIDASLAQSGGRAIARPTGDESAAIEEDEAAEIAKNEREAESRG